MCEMPTRCPKLCPSLYEPRLPQWKCCFLSGKFDVSRTKKEGAIFFPAVFTVGFASAERRKMWSAEQILTLQRWASQRKSARCSIEKLAEKIGKSAKSVRTFVNGSLKKRKASKIAARAAAKTAIENLAATTLALDEKTSKLRRKLRTKVVLEQLSSSSRLSLRTTSRRLQPAREKLKERKRAKIVKNRLLPCTPPSRYLHTSRNICGS